ncbi:MAG: PKD domain-containing protein [Bacteroidota bacterium]
MMTLLVFFGPIGFAQEILDTRWYFGNSSENLVFDLNGRRSYLENTQAVPFGNAGAVTITDQFTGNLLFYSDGVQVFDATHTQVPAATALVGDPSINTPVVTAPVSGNPGQYYLFANPGTTGPNEIQFSIVDATLNGNGTAQFPLGDLTATVNTATGLTDPAQAMMVIPLGDGETFWLLSQNRTTFEVRVTELNGGGIGATNDFNFTNGTTPGFEAAHFAFNPDSSFLAMAPRTANRNVWLMTFDPSNGTLGFDRQLTGSGFNDGAGESIYDVEWSNDGSKLYLSRFGGAGDVANVYQIDLNDTTESVNPIIPTSFNRSYGLQRALDGRIYHLYQEVAGDPFSLGSINRPDSTVDSVNYQPIVFDLNWNAQQFPSFTDAYDFTFDTLNFTYIDDCFENVTKFFPIIEPVPQQVRWDFGDGGSQAYVPLHTYSAEGGYMVSLTAEIAGISQTVTRAVEIFANDLMVDLGNDTTICVDEILTLDAGMGTSFVWNTGELTQTIDVDTAGTYWVEVTNDTGCTDFDDIEVTEYGVADQVANQWYFGEQAGIEFTGGAAPITDGNVMFSEEGCATVSDINGDLLFYTSGDTIWNREHNVMVNGDLIGGDQNAAQSALILPFNEDETMFYVFTTEDVYGDDEYALRYSIVDMKEDESRGEVIVKNIKLSDNSTERVTASGFTGEDALLAHDFGNNNFKVFNTGAEGLTGAIFSPVGEIHQFVDELSATGYMKFSPSLEQIAVNIPGVNQLEILDFDIATGEVSNPRLIDTGETGLYGLEFSNTGNRLYLTTTGANSKLIQYDLDSLDSENPATDIAATKFDGYPQGTDYGALQTGPDGVIYMAVDNSTVIGTISGGDGDDAAAGFNPTGFDLAGRTSRLGLPNFAQNQSPPQQTPSISVTGTCFGQPTNFSATGRDDSIEEYGWIFGDGTATDTLTTNADTTHTYSAPGIYNVQVVLRNRCDVDTVLSTTIEIFAIPQAPTVPTDTVLCGAPIVLEAWPVDDPNLGYFWSTGDSTRQITVSQATFVDVAIIDLTTGCTSDTAVVFVADAGPPIDLGPDLTLCQNDPTVRLDSGIPRATYSWSIDGTVSGANRTFDVTTTTPGTFEYTVEVTNTFGCIGGDTVLVTVLEEPVATFTENDPTGPCGSATGSIDINFNSIGSFSYQVVGPVASGPIVVDVTSIPTTEPIPNLSAGNYTITITNIVTGCSLVDVAQLSDNAFTFAATPTGNCEGAVDIALSTFSMAPPLNYDYSILDESGVEVASATGQTTDPNTSITGLDPGTFFIQVTDNAVSPPCIQTQEITVAPGPDPNFTFDAIQEICGSQGDVLVTDGTGGVATYTWTPTSGIVGSNTGTSIVVNQPGTYTVTTDDGGGAFCPRSEEIEVIFNSDPIVDIVINGDACEGQVTLVANVTNGSGAYVFQWTDGSQAQQNTVTVSGSYSVTVVDQLTGCTATFGPVDVTVEQDFSVVLSLEPNCENSEEVFLIATTNFFDPSISYQWRNGSGELLEDTDSILTVTVSDTYSVTAINPSGACLETEQFNVNVVPINPDDLILRDRATFCLADPIDPTVTLDPGIWNTYEWRLLPDQTIISTDPMLTVSVEGTYEVTLFNGFTCTTDQVVVVEDCSPVIFAPNAFSPNGNGQNEEFFVFPNDYVDDFEIFIYSRWGELVFFSNTQDFRWDGTFNGGLLPIGTYAYILKFSSSLEPELGTIEQYGSVTLIR